MGKTTVTVVVDNRAKGRLLGEHGLSILIKRQNDCILFDAGQGHCLNHNLEEIGVDPGEITDFVISHGHYDHTGGIGVLFENPSVQPRTYFHPAVLEAKYAKDDDGARYIGITEKNRNFLFRKSRELHSSRVPREIAPGITITGEIPSVYPEETVKTKFYCDLECKAPDLLPDDQAMFIRSDEGIIVILGCCHSGLGNTLDYVSKLSGDSNIFAVIGGTHLQNIPDSRLAFTVDIIRKFGVAYLWAGHCTGFYEASYLKNQLPDVFNMAYTGKQLEFGL